MKSSKFIRYSSTVGALLAVSGSAQAVIQPGRIEGDAVLDHAGDFVFIDLDRDGTPDFVGVANGVSYSSVPDFLDFMIYAYDSGNMVDLISYIPFLKKFNLNDLIGPLSYPYYYGIISFYSAPSPTSPPESIFASSDDEGFIGVSMLKPSGTCYGWIQISISPSGNSVEFIASALENTPNTTIVAGNSIPVPLLPIASATGLGLIGLMAALKKRKKKFE